MQIIALASQKGGSGKTTLAGHLAVAAEAAGAGPVVLADTDPQGSLADWWRVRSAPTPLFARTNPQRLAASLSEMRSLGARLLIVDTPPALVPILTEAISLADLVVIPARPSPHDLHAAGATVDLVGRLGRTHLFVVNGAVPRARITGEAMAALAQHGPLARTIIQQRSVMAASMIDGRTAMETEGGERSAAEIRALWAELASLLGKISPRANSRAA